MGGLLAVATLQPTEGERSERKDLEKNSGRGGTSPRVKAGEELAVYDCMDQTAGSTT
uniref:Uncharacterized protein n=1 Tax=Arundo donax TaxID=35708 RepID=A0A0A9ER63_ARUDO